METKFKVGDKLHWTNEQGVYIGQVTITKIEFDKWGPQYFATPKEAYWMYIREENLTITHKKRITK